MEAKTAIQKASTKDFSLRPLEYRKAAYEKEVGGNPNLCPIILELKNDQN